MKKLLSLFVLLVAFVTGVKAADETVFLWQHDGSSVYGDGSNNGEFAMTAVTGTAAFATYEKKQTGNESLAYNSAVTDADLKPTGVTKGCKLGNNGAHIKIMPASGNFKKGDIIYVCAYNPILINKVSGTPSSTGNVRNATSLTGENGMATGTSKTDYNVGSITLDEDLADDECLYISRQSSSVVISAIKVVRPAPAGPTITTQPQSADYASGDPISALTVEATASKGDLAYQWYSCDDADKTNAEEIDGAESASYTPTAAGFYYVNVKDDNGNIDSDVAQITISAAEAPTINVSGAPAEVVKVGTEVILTATATGVPTPTIKWYKKNTLGEVETGATFTVPTDEAGEFTYYAVATNSEGSATSDDQVITVKEQVATPTFNPNGAYFEESQSVVIESATEDAVIEYSTDGGESWTAYTQALNITETTTILAKATKQDYLNSETATATFTKVTLDPQVDVTEAATWDWSKFGTTSIQLTDQTTPSKTTEFVLSNAVNYGLCSAISADFGNAQQLKVTVEYPVRDGKYTQGGSIKFNTTVPGTVTVKYTNTGNRSSEDDRRFLNVNGTNYGEGTMSSKEADAVTTSVNVAAGEVAIKGTLKKDGSDQYLRIYTITFTPATTETITIPEAGVLTYVTQNPVDFSSIDGTIKAYVVTATSTTSATTAEVAAVPAGTPLLIKGVAGDYDVEIVESADAPATNLLQVSNGTVTGGDNIYAYSKSALKFKKVAAEVTIPEGKCYLEIDGNGGDALDIIFDGEATGINDVNAGAEAAAPVKVLTAKGVQIGKFNVAGQQVK